MSPPPRAWSFIRAARLASSSKHRPISIIPIECDGLEAALKRTEVTMLARFKESEIGDGVHAMAHEDLYERVIYRYVIGSQAYGLAGAESDVDRRGMYLPTAEVRWSLYGIPEQLENDETQEA
ncbi:MAG: nucleotidyltransferase domain-containing protein [Planctomycetes bacterium]|nr:nucleotidyltransferase domain-containing protein [Planctomycetota bacterium]